MRKELTHELISRIRSSFDGFKQDIKTLAGVKSDRLAKNIYFAMVYAIIDHYHWGIVGQSGNLIEISINRFADIFKVNRKTLTKYQEDVDYFKEVRYRNFKNLKRIFYDIEEIIIR